jgi:hypothetical protein
MTNIDSHTAVGGTPVTTDIARRAFEIAVAVAIAAALAAAWLALFSLVPFDLRVH